MKKIFPLLLCFMCIAFSAVQCQKETQAAHSNKKVLIIGIDGLLNAGVKAAQTPTIDALCKNGAFTYTAFAGGEIGTATQQATSSGPGWSSILTGVWVNKHSIENNDFETPNFEQYPHFFSRIKSVDSTLTTASYVHWKPIHKHILADADISYEGNDAEVANRAAKDIKANKADIYFIHLDDVDHAGHTYSYADSVSNYTKAVHVADSLASIVVEATKQQADNDWLIILTTDHGGIDKGHGGQSELERNILLIASGDAVPNKGESTQKIGHTAVPPTVCAFLGIEVPAQWGWESKAFGF